MRNIEILSTPAPMLSCILCKEKNAKWSHLVYFPLKLGSLPTILYIPQTSDVCTAVFRLNTMLWSTVTSARSLHFESRIVFFAAVFRRCPEPCRPPSAPRRLRCWCWRGRTVLRGATGHSETAPLYATVFEDPSPLVCAISEFCTPVKFKNWYQIFLHQTSHTPNFAPHPPPPG